MADWFGYSIFTSFDLLRLEGGTFGTLGVCLKNRVIKFHFDGFLVERITSEGFLLLLKERTFVFINI